MTMTEPLSTTVDLVRQYGGPTSHAALIPSIRTFHTPAVDGQISYWLVGRRAVVMGDPICAPENKACLADAFADYCIGNSWSIVYIGATASLQSYALQRGYGSMEFASLLAADPQDDPELGPRARHLRQHLNHVRRTGVTVHEYLGEPDTELETQAQAACEAWLRGRHGPQMYLGRPRLFDDKMGRRWFIAEQAGKVIGYLSLLQVGCAKCQNYINLMFSLPTAPLYTNELMVVTVLRALREEGVNSVCLGVGPLEALGRIEGCSAIADTLSRKFYRLVEKLTHQHNKTLYWEKFRVTQREPLYLLFQSSRIGLSDLYALLRALNFCVTNLRH